MALERASIVDQWLEDEKLMLIECWARDYTKKEIAERIGIAPSTLKYWEDHYEPIKQALAVGKEIIDYKVENALLKRALGYTSTEIKVTLGKQVKNGRVFQITKETTTKEVAPDVTACAMWLNNRRPDRWKRNRDKSIELESEDDSIQITVLRGPQKEEQGTSVNQAITLQKKRQSTQSVSDKGEKEVAVKEDKYDKDCWPDDWEDDDE